MPLVVTPAIVLAGLRYGETSKIVRLATRDHGVQSVIAKGALRPKSRFGAALQFLSGGSAQYVAKEHRELHLLTAFEVQRVRIGLTAQVPRYAAAGALAEVMLRLAPAAPHPDSYAILADALDLLELAPDDAVEVVALRALWQLVAALGYEPAVLACARDGAALDPAAPAAFSVAEGGVLCAACARERPGTPLPPEARAALAAFLEPGAELPLLDDRHAAAHRRLVGRWVRTHLGDQQAALPALDFWLARPWAAA